MRATVADILELVNQIAPPELAEVWDNIGLLAGDPCRPVSTVLIALDLTESVLREAQQHEAQLIITHHPILFLGRKNLREDDAEGRLLCGLIRSNCALIAAHTNYDYAEPGVNDALAQALNLREIQKLPHGLRMGAYDGMLANFAKEASRTLGSVLRVRGDAGSFIQRVAICGGSGGEFWHIAQKYGANCYLTGEIKHHESLLAVQSGLSIVEAGHAETESIAMKALKNGLQNAINEIQYDVTVLESACRLFGG